MKIGELALVSGVSADTLRFYEKQHLLDPPTRADNGYRSYGPQHLDRVRFIRSARGLGFSLAQIGEILPRLAAGQFGRAEIEKQLQAKLAEIEAQILKLQTLKGALLETYASLQCVPGNPVTVAHATAAVPSKPVRIKKLHAE
jgi:DNA-binding transcriptional MerR regulator